MKIQCMHKRASCTVVTVFAEGQPGFLDFSYRVRSLAANYDVTVISSFPLQHAEIDIRGVKYRVIPSPGTRLGWLSYLCRSALMIFRQRPGFVVLLHSMASPVALALPGLKTVTYWNEHPTHVAPCHTGMNPLKKFQRGFIRWLMFHGARRSTRVLPIGEAHRDDLLKHGCDPHKMEMIYMGVDQAFHKAALENTNPDQGFLNLVYIGSVHPERGRDVMLEAVALANTAQKIVHLTMVGASEEQLQYCQEAVARLGIVDSVSLHGRVPGSRIPEFLKTADIGLCLWQDLPWYRFNPPTKLFEYLVAGLPVAASNIRTHTQYVQDGVNGFIFEYGSQSLAACIQKIFENRHRLPELKRNTCETSKPYLWPSIEPAFLAAISRAAA
jgi:glycosyltransferase involved in cell wall biosynthesis